MRSLSGGNEGLGRRKKEEGERREKINSRPLAGDGKTEETVSEVVLSRTGQGTAIPGKLGQIFISRTAGT